MSLAQCKSCKATVIWAKSPKGANLPLDAVVLRGADDPRLTPRVVVYRIETTYGVTNAIPVDRDAMATIEGAMYLSHYATCPDARMWSKGKKREPEPSRQEGLFV